MGGETDEVIPAAQSLGGDGGRREWNENCEADKEETFHQRGSEDGIL